MISHTKEITHEEKLKCWNELPEHVREWILKLTGDQKVKFERDDSNKNNNKINKSIQLRGDRKGAPGKQGKLF